MSTRRDSKKGSTHALKRRATIRQVGLSLMALEIVFLGRGSLATLQLTNKALDVFLVVNAS